MLLTCFSFTDCTWSLAIIKRGHGQLYRNLDLTIVNKKCEEMVRRGILGMALWERSR
jgi:ribosomal protein L24E